MVTSPDQTITVVTATSLETRAVRRAAPRARIVETGVRLERSRSAAFGDVVVTCGLAGGLCADAQTGSVVVPESVTAPDGRTIACDPELVEALVHAAQRFTNRVLRGPMITCATLLNGSSRSTWADRGYVAADMETGLIDARRIAAVRVILDTPARELSDAWLHPVAAFARPGLWPQALWLMREGPRCARLAAQVLAAGLTLDQS